MDDHNRRRARYKPRVGLGGRITWVVQERFAGNASAWSLAAGCSRSMLSTFNHRWKAFRAGTGTEPTLKRPALEALAKAAGVSFEWLATGAGEPVTVREPRYPSLESALESFPGRWLAGAVAQARSVRLDADSDPGEAYWLRFLDASDTGLRVALSGIAKLPDRKVDPLADLDD